jgi:DNA-binding NarL/FixJ family response regulator
VPPSGDAAPPPKTIDQAVALCAQGARIVDIAKQLSIGHRVARRILVDAGVEIRPPGRVPRLSEHQTEVTRLRGEGWSYARIGRHFGVASSTVQAFIREFSPAA